MTLTGQPGDEGAPPLPSSLARSSSLLVDEGEIGAGGSSSVHQVFDNVLRRRVAQKRLYARLAHDPRHLQRFIREAQITAQLEHPNVVPIHELAVDRGGNTYFTMRLVEGRTLYDRVDELRGRLAEPDTLHELLSVFIRVCDAVAFAHARGILHCDIKPENVMTGSFGEAYLMDWGLGFSAGASPGATSPARKNAPGTPAYMSPEQAQRLMDQLGPHTDVFGLGALLYFILSGRPPYDGETVRDAVARAARCAPPPLDGLPPGLCPVVLRAMARAPGDRYPSVKELQSEVGQFLRGGRHLPTRTFAPGAVIVEEGAQGDEAYIIVRGRCRVWRLAQGQRTPIRELGAGAVFGEMAVLSGAPRSATVEAVDEVVVKIVTRELIERQLGIDSWLGQFMLALVNRFRELEDLVRSGPRPG